MAVASMLPVISTLFPLWMLGSGWLAVVLYRRRSSLEQLSSTLGGKIGALAGLLGFVFFVPIIGQQLHIELNPLWAALNPVISLLQMGLGVGRFGI